MSEQCTSMDELLIDYINGNLSKDDIAVVLQHIACCSDCRREMAQLIQFRNRLQKQSISIPKELKESAFAQIPKVSPDTEFAPMTLSEATAMIRSALNPVQKTIKLAMKLI